ncbi:MAG: YggT family protein [Polaromonas sp.]|uniref:YggT family protein n=1 Tax=Polaromonas sp. TaxID=1869339 RepID=UPI0027371BB1|nr:YggT family protein [Polaromonas sp.]MDP2816767.1 YggT family protein [Polaromonas sp.]
MLIRILAFLLETLFFVLIGATLLRAWMNYLRINMRAQPGIFVMAVSDWIVKPLRRVLPVAVAQSRVDWASVLAAFVLALLYALLGALLIGALSGGLQAMADLNLMLLPALLLAGLKMLLRVALQVAFVAVLAFAIISWVQPGSAMYVLLGRLTEPLLAPLRRVIPQIGGVDLSALVLLLLLQIGLMVLG